MALTVEYRVNGVPDPKIAKRSAPRIASAIEATKLFKVRKNAANSFKVVVSEDLDEKDVYAKAKMAAESFGQAGSIAQSHLSFDVDYISGGRIRFTDSSDVTMNLVLGNRSVPDDFEPMSATRAQRALLDSSVRALIRDAYKAGAFEEAQ